MSALRILYVSSAESLGGGERHLVDLANGMLERGHDVYAVVRPSSPLIAELSRLPQGNITVLPLRNALDARSARDLLRLVRSHDIQVVHAHMARDYPIAAFATRKNPNTILVVTRHVLFALNPLHRITLSRAARVIAVSQAAASELLNSRVAAPDKITVVYNGIDIARFARARASFDRQEFLRKWDLPAESLLVGTVGELTRLKGQADFLKAAAEVASHFPQTYFIVAGADNSQDQANSEMVDELIETLKLSDRVRKVEWIEDVAQLYCALDVFVSASHTESFGLAIAEAMACATAVVATATGGAKEVIQSNETGELVAVGDIEDLASTVDELLGNKEERTRLGQAAQRSIGERFTLRQMLDDTERIYREELQNTTT